jgi:hypothetical protein
MVHPKNNNFEDVPDFDIDSPLLPKTEEDTICSIISTVPNCHPGIKSLPMYMILLPLLLQRRRQAKRIHRRRLPLWQILFAPIRVKVIVIVIIVIIRRKEAVKNHRLLLLIRHVHHSQFPLH